MAYPALKVIRPVIRLSSALSPRMTGRLAFRLFCTPIGHARVDPGSPAIRKALTLFERAETRIVGHCRGYVRSFTFEPDGDARGTVLLIHGWTGQAIFMGGFVEPLLAEGFRVLALDLPAHGGSGGRQLNVPLAVEAVSAVVRDHLPLAGIVSHSFGGAIAMAAVAGGVENFPALPCERLVTVAAPDAMQDYGEAFSRAVGLTQKGHHAFENRVLELAGRPMASFSGRAYLAGTQIPTLVIHAPDDREIPFSDAEKLASAGPQVQLLPVPGFGHRRILMAPSVQRAAARFLASGEA
ncbi:alpha/beta fold hydrolase [Rhabdaerophilum sp. SD176]|uniref:alpha/beta fold hydrolase n=1 Tax=Rhabdaerophilum sp. SD176 TaxID=2983548 RepID=UPI0024E00BDC|nr:alpha/beta fold hydrolase [Rhabdaerophilum sp. SD176]